MSGPTFVASKIGAFQPRTRSKFWPKYRVDWGIFIVTLILMPTIYVYEMYTVYPSVWGFAPSFRAIIPYVGVFVFMNIVANFVGLVVTSTEVPRKVMTTTRPGPDWHYCDMCLSYVPPRSWHCKYCKVCILKRDHHCLFGGCCIGQFNYRFFLMYLVYVFLGTLYCVISDTMFLMDKVDLRFPLLVAKVGFPAFAYLSGLETLTNECYILLYIINWIALIFVSIMLKFHVRTSLRGQVTHDVTVSNNKFNLGTKQNVKEVLGNRWYIAWLFPLISSPLPRNGLEWDTNEGWFRNRSKYAQKSR